MSLGHFAYPTGKSAQSTRRRSWATRQTATAILGDARLERRFARILATLEANPHDTIPQACGNWAETKATYRFIENDHIDWPSLSRPIGDATARECEGRDTILVVQDTTGVVFPYGNQTRGLGPVNGTRSRGLFLHSALALDEDGVVIGVLDAHMWARDPDDPTTGRDRQNWPIQDKESWRWIASMRRAREAIDSNVSPEQRPRLIHVQDREGDIHEVFQDVLDAGDGAVIRSHHDRRVLDEAGAPGHAHDLVRRAPLLGAATIDVPRKRNEKARKARVQLRARRLTITPSANKSNCRNLGMTLVEVYEPNPPKGAKRLHWLLWTTEPAETLEQALRVVRIYKVRWRIEDYHFTLKSGCRIEELRMDTAERAMKTIALYTAVAARIVRARDLARIDPEAPCTRLLRDAEWRVLWTAIHHKPVARGVPVPTVRQAVLWIGRLGGHLGRKSDGMPGVKTLWRGWRDLDMLVAYQIALE